MTFEVHSTSSCVRCYRASGHDLSLCELTSDRRYAPSIVTGDKRCVSFTTINPHRLSSPPGGPSSCVASRHWKAIGDGVYPFTTALIDYQANNTIVIELSPSVCFLHYAFELQQTTYLLIQLGAHAGAATGPPFPHTGTSGVMRIKSNNPSQ